MLAKYKARELKIKGSASPLKLATLHTWLLDGYRWPWKPSSLDGTGGQDGVFEHISPWMPWPC